MKNKNIKFDYDRDVDAAYLRVARGTVDSSEEVQPGIIADFDRAGAIVGVEILRFSRRFLSKAPANLREKPIRKSA